MAALCIRTPNQGEVIAIAIGIQGESQVKHKPSYASTLYIAGNRMLQPEDRAVVFLRKLSGILYRLSQRNGGNAHEEPELAVDPMEDILFACILDHGREKIQQGIKKHAPFLSSLGARYYGFTVDQNILKFRRINGAVHTVTDGYEELGDYLAPVSPRDPVPEKLRRLRSQFLALHAAIQDFKVEERRSLALRGLQVGLHAGEDALNAMNNKYEFHSDSFIRYIDKLDALTVRIQSLTDLAQMRHIISQKPEVETMNGPLLKPLPRPENLSQQTFLDTLTAYLKRPNSTQLAADAIIEMRVKQEAEHAWKHYERYRPSREGYLHCECTMLLGLLEKSLSAQAGNRGTGNHASWYRPYTYIGCSKLSCYGCHCIFEAFRNTFIQNKLRISPFYTAGSHSKPYPGYRMPQFHHAANAPRRDNACNRRYPHLARHKDLSDSVLWETMLRKFKETMLDHIAQSLSRPANIYRRWSESTLGHDRWLATISTSGTEQAEEATEGTS